MYLSSIAYQLIGLFITGFLVRSLSIYLYTDVEIDVETVGGFGFFMGLLLYGLGYYYSKYHTCKAKEKSWKMTSQFMADNEPVLHKSDIKEKSKEAKNKHE
ncbi:MAG: hypothetical protein U9Q62_03890 [Campylobacterota bacterium]|nr:hypothetical protein [Campylobacterota bacterium]